MKEYHQMCAEGAKALADMMAATAMAERVYVFAIHGAHDGPVMTYQEAMEDINRAAMEWRLDT